MSTASRADRRRVFGSGDGGGGAPPRAQQEEPPPGLRHPEVGGVEHLLGDAVAEPPEVAAQPRPARPAPDVHHVLDDDPAGIERLRVAEDLQCRAARGVVGRAGAPRGRVARAVGGGYQEVDVTECAAETVRADILGRPLVHPPGVREVVAEDRRGEPVAVDAAGDLGAGPGGAPAAAAGPAEHVEDSDRRPPEAPPGYQADGYDSRRGEADASAAGCDSRRGAIRSGCAPFRLPVGCRKRRQR